MLTSTELGKHIEEVARLCHLLEKHQLNNYIAPEHMAATPQIKRRRSDLTPHQKTLLPSFTLTDLGLEKVEAHFLDYHPMGVCVLL